MLKIYKLHKLCLNSRDVCYLCSRQICCCIRNFMNRFARRHPNLRPQTEFIASIM